MVAFTVPFEAAAGVNQQPFQLGGEVVSH